MKPDTALLRAQGIGLRLGGRAVLDRVDLSLAPGWTAVVGPNGAGKSTLLRVLAGLQAPDEGHVALAGRPLADWPHGERARRIAWLAQTPPDAVDTLTVRDVVALGRLPHLGLFGTPTATDTQCMAQAMAAADCIAWQDRGMHTLSGGERQRALVARALAVGADVLLLDEPTTHLDPQHQVAQARLMRRCAQQGMLVASVLHDLSLALQADRVVVLREGVIAADALRGDPALHAALAEAFDGAVRVERVGAQWAVLPRLET